ncbi:MAG: LAGLIDADG family homing endonuclease [bacterium]
MSRIVASAAIRGAHKIVEECEDFLRKAISEKGESQRVEFPETAFYLPMANALLGAEVKTLGEMVPILDFAKSLLPPVPSEKLWLPYLGNTLDAGIATLLGEEMIVALRYLYGQEPQPDCNGFFTDTILRALGIQLVDGRMPGFAAILGAAPDTETAVYIVRELQKRNILIFVGSSVNGRSIVDQLREADVEMGWETYIVPYGRDTISAIYPLNWAIRAAMTFGGIKPGNGRECLLYTKNRVFAFGLALGEVDDLKYATGAGAINMGFPVIADTDIPEIRPTGICTYEHLVKEFDHKKIVPTCIEVRGVKVKVTELPIPVSYSAAFEGERVRKEQMHVQFGGKYSTSFEYLRSKELDEVEDGKIEVIGPDVDSYEEGGAYPLGIVVDVAGRKMKKDFEPILERQFHRYINWAMGIFHMGQRDINWIRISKDAFKAGFRLRHFGDILRSQLLNEYGAIVDKVQVTIYSKQEDVDRIIEEARQVYHERDARVAGMTDESVDIFYSCTLCVPAGESIVLPDGSFKRVENFIEDAVESDATALSFDEDAFRAKPVEELFVNPAPSQLWKIYLSNGNSLTLTGNHRVLVDRKEGLEWVRAARLKLGDRLVSPSITAVEPSEEEPCIVDYLPDDLRGVPLGKSTFDEDLMYAIGLVASDGCVKRRGKGLVVQFTNSDLALVDRFNAIMRETFGVEPKTYTVKPSDSSSAHELKIDSRSEVQVSYVNSQVAGRLMLGLGLSGDPDRDERWTGDAISKFPPRLVSAYLRGLFDGDGHVTKSHISISTRSYREAQHTLLLLKKLGIEAYISAIKRGFQVGTRNARSYIQFREKIGSHHPKKWAKMLAAKFDFDSNHVSKTDLVPFKCGKLLGQLMAESDGRIEVTKLPVDYRTLMAWIKGERRPSREKFALLVEDLANKVDQGNPAFQELLRWSKAPVHLERVKRVDVLDNSDRAVYNFSVEGTHNYLVNGVVVKNCQSYAPNHVCIISPERLGLCGAYNWLDGRTNYEINPTGHNQPVPKGEVIDPVKGQWKGINEFVYLKSNRTLERFNAYSVMVDPMTSCLVEGTEVIIDGKVVEMNKFIDKHRGGEEYAKSSALTLNGGKAASDKIVAMQKFPAPEKLVRIKTKSGVEITLTPNHKVAVDRPNGLAWIEAGQVKEKDRLISLRKLNLEDKTPDIIDIIPGDFRIGDGDLIEEVKSELARKYGSLASAYRKLGLKPTDPRAKSIPIKSFKLMIDDLGRDWDRVKKLVASVTYGASTVNIPRGLSEGLFYLMGLVASDGSVSKRGNREYRIDFINTDEGLVNRFREIYLGEFPGRKINIRRKNISPAAIEGREIKSTGKCFQCYFNNPLFGTLCEHYGIKVGAHGDWNLGRMIGLPQRLISAFIAGLFDGDGSARLRRYDDRWDIGEAYLCINDRRAAHHLQLLLKRLGIVGNVREAGSVYKVELHGSNLARFAESIESAHTEKRTTLEKIKALSVEERIDKTQEQILPLCVGKELAEHPASKGALSPSTLYYYKTGRSGAAASNIRKAIESVPDAQHFKTLLDTDYFLDIVTKAEEIRNSGEYKFVYNLTLADIHCYFANQILCANCGCFECILALIPEANGFMIVNREYPGMTPIGMTFSTLAGSVGGGVQTPGFLGVGRLYVISRKFILGDGGLKRMVWMTKELKESLREGLERRSQEIGIPDFIDKICDETIATTVDELLPFLEKVGHPALTMEPLM